MNQFFDIKSVPLRDKHSKKVEDYKRVYANSYNPAGSHRTFFNTNSKQEVADSEIRSTNKSSASLSKTQFISHKPTVSSVAQKMFLTPENAVKQEKQLSFNAKNKLIMSAAIILFFGGLATLAVTMTTNTNVTTQIQSLSNNRPVLGISDTENDQDGIETDQIPREDDQPSNIKQNYSVAGYLPKKVTIANIGVDARIVKVGTGIDNAIKTPSSIFDVGWYQDSSLPGDTTGATLLLAHVSGPTKQGVFYNLKKLKNGDSLSLEMGSGKVLLYKVVSSSQVPVNKIDMSSYLIASPSGKSILNIMTCGGKLDPKTNDYSDRIIVTAELQ